MQGPIPKELGEIGLRVALSVGELDKEAYQKLYDAGKSVWHGSQRHDGVLGLQSLCCLLQWLISFDRLVILVRSHMVV